MTARVLVAGIAALASRGAGAAQPPVAAAGCAVPGYRVVAVPLHPVAINEAGEVAGTTAAHRAAVWTGTAGLRELPLPAGFARSEAVGVNRHGHVAGNAFDAAFVHHRAFVAADGVVTLLPGEEARAHHINDLDTVGGESQVAGTTTTQPVLWLGGRLQVLDACCGGSVTYVDPTGRAAGAVYDSAGRYQAFQWTAQLGMQRIGPADRYSTAVAANGRGDVVVQAFAQVLLYRDGSLRPLQLAARYPSHPHAINDCGVIVGAFGPYSDADRAFRWDESGGFQDLNDLIPAGSGWTLESATGINARGEIVGNGDHGGADDAGFLLVPVPGTPPHAGNTDPAAVAGAGRK